MARNPKKKRSKKKKEATEAEGDGDVDMAGNAETAGPSEKPKVWRPGVDNMEDGEELQFDPTAYDCLHTLRLEWPCLSFDIVRDALGDDRKSFPHSLFCVAGTQAGSAGSNSLAVMRMANLTKMKQPKGGEDSEDDESSESEAEEEEEGAQNGAAQKPVLQVKHVAHHAGVNRVRSMPQQPHIAVTWGETRHVQVWDISAHLRALSSQGASSSTGAVVRQAPLYVFNGHTEEGFAVDWSPVKPGRLATGDCFKQIYVWEPTEGGKWVVEKKVYKGHTNSVEDIQWSPTEESVFASCSVDQTIRVWDVRQAGEPALTVKAHDNDVNVISWNRLASCMLASGCDDGSFRIWDLRNFKEDSFVAHFKYHTKAVTSLEWSPFESSTIAVSSADNQLTIWDLSLERDPEEEKQYEDEAGQPQAEAPEDLPAQLLFVHQGQKNLKELHWHPQIPGMIVSTAEDGFNAFKPSNL